jgi:hypothetical protein
VYSKVRKREVGDWFAAKKLQDGEEKRVVWFTETDKNIVITVFWGRGLQRFVSVLLNYVINPYSANVEYKVSS